MPEIKTIDQKVREFCAGLRSQDYTEEEIFFALNDEAVRIDHLAEITVK